MENKIQTQMRKWILDFLILWILKQKWRSFWAEIIETLKESNMIVVEWTIYPLLSKLKSDELIDYFWEESEAWHPRKYYYLTKTWEENYKIVEKAWLEIKQTIKNTLNK